WGEEGGRRLVPPGPRSNPPLAASAATVQADHLGSQSGLVEKDEPGRIHVTLPDPPAVSPLGDIGTILLDRPQRLFLNRRPSRRSLAWIVVKHTDMPRCCRSSSPISPRVMSGRSATSAGSRSSCGANTGRRCPP